MSLLSFDLKNFSSLEAKKLGQRTAQDFLKTYSQTGGDFFDVPLNTKTASLCQEFAKHAKRFKEVVILGIGGSSLGPQVLLSAFPPQDKRFYVLDNLDPTQIAETFSQISWNKTLFLAISKSGTTTETLSQFFLVERELNRRKLPINRHLVCITDLDSGPLWEFSKQAETFHFPIPQKVGGRFSVLTSVGLLPAALAGINPQELLKGARAFRDEFVKSSGRHPLAELAAAEFLQSKKGLTSRSTLVYSQQLKVFNAWLKQLLAESLGKDGKGITPLSFTGVTDQHSEIQLYLQGRPDKYFIFLHLDKFDSDFKLPKIKHPKLQYLSAHKLSTIFHAEEDGVRQALLAHNFPVATLSLGKLTPASLGALFFASELETALLGQLLEVNPYNQPGVEEGKKITQALLTKTRR